MNKFSEAEAYEAAHDFVVINNLLMPEPFVVRLGKVAEVTWNYPAPVAAKTQHEFVYQADTRAGRYRDSVLINRLGQMRDYPPASQVSQLMVRLFIPSYKRIFDQEVKCRPEISGDAAWQIGAILRSIHPFEKGNLVLSWVIENQLRLRFGLPIELALRPKAVFDTFRYDIFFPLVEKMLK
jgi:hypothetical protein